MKHNEHERSPDIPRDPVLEEAFGILVRHARAPLGFRARVMARIAAASPTLRDRLMRWLLPLSQSPLAGNPISAPSTVFHAPLALHDREIMLHRIAVAEERLQAAENMLQAVAKILQEAYKELREIGALVADMPSEEEEDSGESWNKEPD